MPERTSRSGRAGGRSPFWMRSVSFAGLHRMLHAAASAPNRRTTALGLNELVVRKGFALTRRPGVPSPTTFYHYRTTLLRLGALRRRGRSLSPNDEDPRVRTLLNQPVPHGRSLGGTARNGFAALVLDNADCRALFFDLFMPDSRAARSVSAFCGEGLPVGWRRDGPAKARRVVFRPSGSGQRRAYSTPSHISATLYGIRYWARDELGLIDEYVASADGSVTMFPVLPPVPVVGSSPDSPPPLVRRLLDERGPGVWTLLSVSDLIVRHCRDGRQPISALSAAIDWLVRHRSDSTVLIPTSRAMATLTATSPMQERLVLRSYYRRNDGPYISHIRLHAATAADHPASPHLHAAPATRPEAHA